MKLSDVAPLIITRALERVRVAMSALISDSDGSTATVQPLVEDFRLTSDGLQSRGSVVLPGVRVIHLGGQNASISFPIGNNDEALLIQRDIDHSGVDSEGTNRVHQPVADRRFNLADTIALPVVSADQMAGGGRYDDVHTVIYLGAGVELRVGDSNASEMLARVNDVQKNLDILKDAVLFHTHPVPGGTSGQAMPATPITFAPMSSKVKVN